MQQKRVLQELHAAGELVSAADVEYLSPNMTAGVKRFGNYHLDLKRPPEPWAVDELDKLVAGMVDQRGLRETLLRLHGDQRGHHCFFFRRNASANW